MKRPYWKLYCLMIRIDLWFALLCLIGVDSLWFYL